MYGTVTQHRSVVVTNCILTPAPAFQLLPKPFLVSGPQTAFRLTRAHGEVSVICNLIARRKVVCAIGLGFSVHSASIPAQAIIGCDGVSYSITDHKAYLVVGAYKGKG